MTAAELRFVAAKRGRPKLAALVEAYLESQRMVLVTE